MLTTAQLDDLFGTDPVAARAYCEAQARTQAILDDRLRIELPPRFGENPVYLDILRELDAKHEEYRERRRWADEVERQTWLAVARLPSPWRSLWDAL